MGPSERLRNKFTNWGVKSKGKGNDVERGQGMERKQMDNVRDRIEDIWDLLGLALVKYTFSILV